jgi:hypothetical protein
MSRKVIVRINDHTEPVKSKDGRHMNILSHYPSDWVILVVIPQRQPVSRHLPLAPVLYPQPLDPPKNMIPRNQHHPRRHHLRRNHQVQVPHRLPILL